MVLLDSTIYINWFRARVEPAQMLRPWIAADTVAICGVVRAEVIRGLITPHQKQRAHELFDLFREVEMDARPWRETAELAWRLDRQGVVLPLTDIAIAACALSIGAIVITTDHHFRRISKLNVRSELPKFDSNVRS